MHRTAVSFLTLAFVTLAATPPAHAQQGPNLRSCYDGRCAITVTSPVSFPLSSRYGFTRLTVARTGSSLVKISGTGDNGSAYVVLSAGGNGTLNNLGVRAVSITPTKASLTFAPTR